MVSQDMCGAMITTLYKNKGTWSDCNDHMGFSLLGVAGKAFTRVVLPTKTG